MILRLNENKKGNDAHDRSRHAVHVSQCSQSEIDDTLGNRNDKNGKDAVAQMSRISLVRCQGF